MNTNYKYLISQALSESTNAIAYYVQQQIAALYPNRVVIEGRESDFKIEAYAGAGLCTLEPNPALLNHIVSDWEGPGHSLEYEAANAWYRVAWEGHTFDLLLITWTVDGCAERHHWLLADEQADAERFLLAVLEWCSEVRGEVLVFANGGWEKDADLYKSIRSATYDNLILPPALKAEIRADFAGFFAGRAMYERYRIPWKRGILLIGPPGNGKTHTVKAIANALGQPCLYVKSFKARYSNEHESIRRVFKRARMTTPCLLILEDLDSLVDDKNRSFFLNELDGFAANTGIVVLATTNHPERLDPAILERPSRFDRKYHFNLPAAPEREAYISRWNDEVEPDLRLSPDGIAALVAATNGYSFAYLKELFVSAMMRWINAPTPGHMIYALLTQTQTLREQMQSAMKAIPAKKTEDEDEEE